MNAEAARRDLAGRHEKLFGARPFFDRFLELHLAASNAAAEPLGLTLGQNARLMELQRILAFTRAFQRNDFHAELHRQTELFGLVLHERPLPDERRNRRARGMVNAHSGGMTIGPAPSDFIDKAEQTALASILKLLGSEQTGLYLGSLSRLVDHIDKLETARREKAMMGAVSAATAVGKRELQRGAAQYAAMDVGMAEGVRRLALGLGADAETAGKVSLVYAKSASLVADEGELARRNEELGGSFENLLSRMGDERKLARRGRSLVKALGPLYPEYRLLLPDMLDRATARLMVLAGRRSLPGSSDRRNS